MYSVYVLQHLHQKQGIVVPYDCHKSRFCSQNMFMCFCLIITEKISILLKYFFPYFYDSHKNSEFHHVILLCVLRFSQKYRLFFQDIFECFTRFSYKSNFFLTVITKVLIVPASFISRMFVIVLVINTDYFP